MRRGGGIGILLLTCVLLLCVASSAQAQDCSDYPNGVIDGFAGDTAPAQLQIDRNCTIRNFPASNPLRTNFSFLTQPGQTDERWLIVFDNVVHVGQMACNSVAGHKIWFVNGSSSSIQEGCQNLLIPVEKIDKQTPAGQTTAAIGVPFTYTLTIPVLFDPATGNVINSEGSPNDVHSVLVTDDLNETGVVLSYLSHVAYWRDSGTPVAHSFSNVGGALTFNISPIIPAGEQIVIEITVVLNDTPANAPGTQFINTAKWEFGRLIDDVFYHPLPGEWGVSPPLTIAGPDLVVTKTGPATLGRTLNLGEWGVFFVDIQNTGLSDAWDVTIVDRLPDGATGGMCDTTPELLSVQVFEADGATPASPPLTEGADFSLSYAAAPTCELTLTMLTAGGAIGPDQRLILSYQSKLDADSQDGATLTNVAGATQWFNGDASNPDRVVFARALTDGTVGVLDHEDAHTVTVALSGYFFEKSVANLTSGTNPTATAAPGDTLRYTLRLQATDVALDDVAFYDDLGELNAGAVFEPGTLSLVTVPGGADASSTDPTGGTNGAGILDIRGLNVPVESETVVQFDITVDPTLVDGTVILNQADLVSAGTKIADSDDPNINGQADPNVAGDEDPTRVIVQAEPPVALLKATTQPTAAIGESFTYQITVPETPNSFPSYDVQITDDFNVAAADLRFLGVTKISGSGAWTPVNTGSAKNVVIEDPAIGIDIPAGEQIVIEITVVLEDTPTNVAGLSFTNTASYRYYAVDGDPTSDRPGAPGTSPPMTVVEPELTLMKSGPATIQIGTPETFTLDVQNVGDGRAWNVTLTDLLPDSGSGGTCDTPPAAVSAQIFEADGTTPVSGVLVQDTDYSIDYSGAPNCLFTFRVLTDQGTIASNQRLIVHYDTRLDVDTQDGAVLTNVAGAVEWFSFDAASPDRRTYTRVVTDGTVGVLDHEDAHTLSVGLPSLAFEKTVVNVTSGADPGVTAVPGDLLRYTLRLENQSDVSLDDFAIVDDLGSLNTSPVFEPGTLALVVVPAGSDLSATDPVGGSNGTGLLDLRSLSLSASGQMIIEFEVTLAGVIANGTLVTNQSKLLVDGTPFAISDDPNVNGAADPGVSGDEDPTQVLVQSAPSFQVEKVSEYVTGDPTVLLAGETLRYTITVANLGTDDAINVTLRDPIPANTSYVPGSTTLNGAPVPDGAGGIAPLATGVLVNAAADPTAGSLPADPSSAPQSVATIVFEVVVDANVIDGTIISNQGFVTAVTGGVVDQPSDDPRTPIPDDPTRDAVGSVPLLFSTKDVMLLADAGTPGVVDPGDSLRYTIVVTNSGSVPATDVVLRDTVPANTSYIADSTTLNDQPVGQPDGGVSPLIAGFPISSSDLTPPLPALGTGTINAGEAAVVAFDLLVDAGVPSGTIISNQAVVTSEEIPPLLTDGDGDPSTGPEPTVVVVGDGQQLSIVKQVAVVGGGPALAGSQVEYVVRVVNVASVPAYNVVITDDLDAPIAGQLVYVNPSATMNGSTSGVTVVGSLIAADYSSEYGPLPPGEAIVLRFRAVIDASLAIGTTITNIGLVTWNTPPQTASASVSIDVGGMPGVGILSGTVWHDADFDRTVGGNERLLGGWAVDLYRDSQLVQTVLTEASGTYSLGGVIPNYPDAGSYELRFRAPGAGANTAALGTTDSAFTNGPQRISEIVVPSGSNIQNLNLPIDPNGVVYGSIGRAPIAGASLSMLDATGGQPLPASCFDEPTQQGQVTLGDGYYKFDLNFSQPACPSGANYLIAVAAPGAGYVAGYSQIIPPLSDASTPPLAVPACPGSADDAVPFTAQHCEAQVSEFAPPTSVPARTAGTNYHVHLLLDESQVPGSSQIFNNHIPLDAELEGAVAITKTTPSVNVNRGQQVPYEITISNELGVELTDLTIVDRFPAGFRYVEGSARLEGVAVEPTIQGRELRWAGLSVASASRSSLVLLLAVGAGVGEGEFVNRAQAVNSLTGGALSGEATATVRVVPDPTFDCTDVIGKVFGDANRNGVQDSGEAGLPGVRLVTARGLVATTDPHGRFHITCAVTPNEQRGSNFILKLDDRTLPTGFRMSSRPVQVQRATRGKVLRFNYAASIHRVVSLDVADGVFEPGSTEMRPQWKPRLDLLVDELKKEPATLRLSYVADVEDEQLVERRLNAIKEHLKDAWNPLDAGYRLTIEPEVFWRRGGPPVSPPARPSESR